MIGALSGMLARRRVEAEEADDLMSRFDGHGAYSEARRRGIATATGALIDPGRPPGHWHRVRSMIRKRTGYEPAGAEMR